MRHLAAVAVLLMALPVFAQHGGGGHGGGGGAVHSGGGGGVSRGPSGFGGGARMQAPAEGYANRVAPVRGGAGYANPYAARPAYGANPYGTRGTQMRGAVRTSPYRAPYRSGYGTTVGNHGGIENHPGNQWRGRPYRPGYPIRYVYGVPFGPAYYGGWYGGWWPDYLSSSYDDGYGDGSGYGYGSQYPSYTDGPYALPPDDQGPPPDGQYDGQYRAPYEGVVAQPDGESSQDAVVLVFKDGRPSQTVRNYMLSQTTLTVMDGRPRVIPVNELDLVATEKANWESGVEFRLPR